MTTRLSLLALALAAALAAACKKDLVCPQGEADCGGRCVSLLSDEANCGACGTSCGPLETCSGGACACARGIAECGGACTDLARDADNCGACGAACDGAELCSTSGGETACTSGCGEGLAACGRACVDLATDRYHCGACGEACADGEVCRDGACRAEIYVACYATGDVRPVDAALGDAGAPRPAGGSPTALAVTDLAIYTANGYPVGGVGVLPLGPQLAAHTELLDGDDVQDVSAHGGAIFAANAAVGTLAVLDPAGALLDEVVMPGERPNPHGLAAAGAKAYVPLFGKSAGAEAPPTGQAIARLDLSGLGACLEAGAGAGGCAEVVGTIDLRALEGSATEGAYPFPASALAVGQRVFVTLSNLRYADCGFGFFEYCQPAGSGRLAVIDTADDGVSIVDLGEGCKNPGALAVSGATLWISCGSFGFPDLAPGALLPVEISAAPAPGAPLPTPPGFVPGSVAFCKDRGYVTDQGSGDVLAFDPAARSVASPQEVCPLSQVSGFAWAADIACSE